MKYLFNILILIYSLLSFSAYAGNQQYESLSNDVKKVMRASIFSLETPFSTFKDDLEKKQWIESKIPRIIKKFGSEGQAKTFLETVHYEATRTGFSPELILSLIQVESGFKKYAISSAGAVGYMQIMPFWVDLIGVKDHSLFDTKTNIRYGCTILKHYLDVSKGNLDSALARYNGSLGKREYPDMVLNTWRNKWM